MIRSISKDITIVANGEATEDIVTGSADKNYVVRVVTGEAHDDLTLVGYLDQDKVIEVALSADAALRQFLPVDLPIPVGQTFKLGVDDAGSGLANAGVVAMIQEG